jgi:hypothetical protein
MSIGISYTTISMHLIMVFLIKIARKITAFNKICTHHGTRQYGIRQSGTNSLLLLQTQ